MLNLNLQAISGYMADVFQGRDVFVGNKKARWTKVKDLKVGARIAIMDSGLGRNDEVGFDEIVSVKSVGREQVYDIEVEGTRNFVGNGIVAHNTYLQGTASVAGTLTLDSATSQINATNNRSLDLGFATTGRINFMTTNSYVDASGNISTNGQVRVGNMASAPTALGAGSMYFDTTNSRLYAYNGSSWGSLGDSSIVTATNTSGGTLANRALVVFDNSNNNSVTTTTTAYQKKAYGVVNQTSTCSASASCEIQIAGSANVTVTNTTTVAKGDYVYTSATAGSAVTSAKLFDGMIGVVTDTSTSGSGYVKMVFAPQAQVTAGVSIDKGSKHNDYWNLVKNYLPLWDGTSPNQNISPRGLMFDNFSDLTKIDAVNTTVSGASGSAQISNGNSTAPFRMGLSGGQTMATSTTDNAGNTYLGSNTVNKVFYYDRNRDSNPQVQVELGIDPNWYNGVTLSVATTSANFSQNTTIVKNPSLSTVYNGSLVKVTGTYASNAKTIYITINGNGNSFAWTDYNGNAGIAAMTPGTAQSLVGTVAVTFSNAKYNPGDVFKIASWVVEPTGSTRGTKAQFPERSYVVGTASSLDIIDADTQKLWMRFNEVSSQWSYIGWDTTATRSSVNALNGIIYMTDSQATYGALLEVNFMKDNGRAVLDSTYGYGDWQLPIASRNSIQAFSGNTSYSIVNRVANDVSAAVIPNQPTQTVTVSGWGYIQGVAAESVNESVNFPYKFNGVPVVSLALAGSKITTAPANLGECTTTYRFNAISGDHSSTGFTAKIARTDAADGNLSTSYYYCYTWTATGQVSPRQYVGVATGATSTDGGTTIINETDQTSANVIVGSQHGNAIWTNKVALLNDGTLYTVHNDDTAGQSVLNVYRYIPSLSSETSLVQYRAGSYGAGPSAAGTWTSPVLLESVATNQINSLSVTPATSTIDGKSNTIYVGSNSGFTVIQEKQSGGATIGDGTDENSGSVKYYTKDYVTEEMVGDIRGMWPLSANGAIFMSDASVKAHTLTNNGTVTAITGVRGVGVSLNGTTQYLTAADSDDWTFAGDFTLGAWIKPSALARSGIFSQATDANNYWHFRMDSDGGLRFYGQKASSAAWDFSVGSGGISTGNWYFVTITRSGNNWTMYRNGVIIGSTTDTDTFANLTSALYIGSEVRTSAENFFAGSLDEPFVTANALTAGQIKHMYEVGYRALQNHSGGDTNQQLGGTTNVVGDAKPDFNNQFMYVGTNSTTLGAVSKIDLNSDTNVKTYNSSANVPVGGPLLIDEDTKSLAVGYNLEAVGSATTGVKTMGQDDFATATSGNFVSKTLTTPESFNQAYLWTQYVSDSSDVSNLVTVWASNDGGTNYYQCNLTNTDANQTPSEYEYFCQFNTAGSSLKTKFVMARGSTKTNTYVTRYGIAWIGTDSVVAGTAGNGLYTNNNATVANGSYIDVAHNQGTNDAVISGWVYNTTTSKWENADVMSPTYATGGTIATASGYTTHTFTSTGTVNFVSNGTGVVDYLVVGGGGGGGRDPGTGTFASGGGGAGGFITGTGFAITPQTYTVTVGTGGAGSVNFSTPTNGADSVFSTITATGGGRGGYTGASKDGATGGSGGGGGTDGSTAGAGGAGNTPSTSPAQGTAGGNAADTATGGGGGGASAAGSGRQGGAGTASSISGSSVTYAGGGSGGGSSGLSGGSGGGGTGGASFTAGTANTGGGGGGGYGAGDFNSGNGGSGIVIVRYATNGLLAPAFKAVQVDTNTVRLYNYSGSTQNLRLDVITGGLGRNLGTVSLAPSAADVDTQNNMNSIWVNKTGTGGTLLKLQQSGTDVLNLSSTALTLTGNFLPGTDNLYSLGASSSARWKDVFVGPGSVHFQSKSTDSGYPALGLDYAMGINTAGSLVTSLNGTSLMTIDQSGTVAIPRNATISGTLSMGPMLQVDAGTCNAAAKGKQYYDAASNSYYFCNGTAWGAIATPETTGQIAAFASACPTGWTEYTAARGRTVVGTPGSGTNEGTVGTALTNLQNKTHTHTGPSHTHTYTTSDFFAPVGGGTAAWTTGGASSAGGTGATGTAATGDVIPYIQLTYCSKNAGADLAEWVPTSEDVSAATIVSVDPANNEKLIASRKPYDSTVVGIIATKPGWLIGDETPGSAQMALAGRVPTRVTLKNGDINRGDAITTSDIAGVGMKATLAGSIIGKAMEPLNEQSALTDCGNGDKCGVIAVFVNVSFYDPATSEDQYDTLVATSQFIDENLVVSDTAEVGDMVNLSYSFVGDTDQGTVLPTDKNDSELTPVGILGDGGDGQILQKIRLNGILVGMKSLITGGVTEVNIASTSAQIHKGDLLGMSEIKGKAKKSTTIEPIIGKALEDWTPESGQARIKVSVNPGTNILAIYAASTETTINIATISAQMDKLTSDVSTILSELPQIKSDIEMLKEEMASVSARLAHVEGLGVSGEGLVATMSATFDNIDVATMSAQFGTFTESLKVIGTTQLANTSIGGKLTVGLIQIDDLKAEISSLTGNVTINSNLNVMGDATVSGQLKVKKGIVLPDTITGEDYCVQVTNGEIVKTKGSCQ